MSSMLGVSTQPDPWSQAEPFAFAGVGLLDTDLDGAVDSILAAVASLTPQGLHLCNAYTLSLAMRDESYRRTLAHDGAVNLPDGTPVCWYYRLSCGEPARGPVRGPSLMAAVLRTPGLRHYLLGGTPEVLEDLERVIAEDFPEAKVVGGHAPPFRDPGTQEIEDFADAIRQSGADIVWVGLGTPRQDAVIAQLVGRVDAVLIGVGAAFDFLAQHKPEAPAWLHRTGLEWVYRLLSEPRRLWRRYLIGNSLFVVQAMRQLSARQRR